MDEKVAAADESIKAFERLHIKVQETLYKMRWKQLKPIQVEAIQRILEGDGDLVISAATAGGKTEAAFLPIISKLAEAYDHGVQVVYVGPLKALINDQFQRIEDLCKLVEIPVHRWHGDVGQSAKANVLQKPSGILLITPESIESLFINHPTKLHSLFSELKFIVVDEMHAFFGSERGAHLRSLMARTSAFAKNPPRRVGLSATVGDIELACDWIRGHSGREVHATQGVAGEREIKLAVHAYLTQEIDPESDEVDLQLESDVFQRFNGRTALIFGNRKTKLEECADFARKESARLKIPNGFQVHHGSLSTTEREDAEVALKAGRPIATFCSSTLEMGIDVGDVEIVGQIDAPFSVNSLVQRSGRSGRREGTPSLLRLFLEETHSPKKTSIVRQIYPHFLRGIAIVELMVATPRWVEPPETRLLYLSTLIQQILSLIAERKGVQAADAFRALVSDGAFSNVDQASFVQVLRDMGAADLIEQSVEGLLILGLKGEKLVHDHRFYVSFQVPEDYKITHDGRHIGNMALDPGTKEGYLILSGKCWKIVEIDELRKSVLVTPSPTGRPPQFEPSTAGVVHARVHQMMRDLLIRDEVPAYIDSGAKSMLISAREAARVAKLDRVDFVEADETVYWFPWAGSRVHTTLAALAKLNGASVELEGPSLRFNKSTKGEICSMYLKASKEFPKEDILAKDLVTIGAEKYELYLGNTLRARVTGARNLDLVGADHVIQQMLCK